MKASHQHKLRISQPGDALEREADRVADQVMRMHGPALDAAGIGAVAIRGALQRKTQDPQGAGAMAPGLDSIAATLRQGGRALDPAARAFLEPRFGIDFSAVRIHTGSQAAASARAINARAYTVGSDVVFDTGEYAPHRDSGMRLLAHELAHVVQQGAARAASPGAGGQATAGRIASAAPQAIYRDTRSRVDETVEKEARRDEVDAFLASRLSLYKVALVGMQIHVSLPRAYEWTKRYTDRALTEAAVGAALNALYMGGVTTEQARKVWSEVVGRTVRLMPAQAQARASTQYAGYLVIDGPALQKISSALNLTPRHLVEPWRLKIGEAKLIEMALLQVVGAFDRLVPYFAPEDLAAAGLSVEMIRLLLDKHLDSMIDVARRHAAARPWRQAFERNLALHWAEREPMFADLDPAPPEQWARTVLDLAAATRDTLRKQHAREVEERRRHARNEHLRPHEIPVEDAARFILENFDPAQTARLHTTGWAVHGGLQLTNIKGEPIYLLRVRDGRVIFQHLGNKRFYEQTLEGFGEEQLYGIYAAAGRKAQGAITLTKWVLGLAGAVFPVVRYGLLATDVLNAAAQLEAHRAELERHYGSLKLAYANIDGLLPGVLPRIWDAVLDKRNATLFNPLQNPDAGAWLKAVIRLVMLRQARVVSASYAADAVSGFLNKAWAAMKKGLFALWEVVEHVIVLVPPIAGSTGVSGQRALDLAQQRLKELGVVDAMLIGAAISRLSRGDQDRLSREIQDLVSSGTQLLEVVEQSMAW
jgi:hypothetical protein